jgi:hypothetical protein
LRGFAVALYSACATEAHNFLAPLIGNWINAVGPSQLMLTA